jgi:hypothetical protein
MNLSRAVRLTKLHLTIVAAVVAVASVLAMTSHVAAVGAARHMPARTPGRSSPSSC